MRPDTLFIPASAAFWDEAARRFLGLTAERRDFSGWRVLVPTFAHAQYFRQALAAQLAGTFIPPRIQTVFAMLEMQAPDPALPRAAGESERLMGLYAELREHAWLKKLFAARRNTDLLPLAQTLLTLSDELTQAFLPQIMGDRAALQARWHEALAQLPQPAQGLLSDETRLVWSVWQSQLDGGDALLQRHVRLQQLAAAATEPLYWISPVAPDTLEQAFLDAYAARQPVTCVQLDWQHVAAPLQQAWPLLQEPGAATLAPEPARIDVQHVALACAASLEDEAVQGAQRIVDWLVQGKQRIAVVAQDRVAARRLRALLERAGVQVADETGWKLSTTRAAAAVAAWFEAIATDADTVVLLDLLKSPYLELAPDAGDKGALLMQIEARWRRANVLGGWEAVSAACAEAVPAALPWLRTLARAAAQFRGRRTLAAWGRLTLQTLLDLNLRNALQTDAAGAQVLALLQDLCRETETLAQEFSFSEWRSLINLRLESAPFTVARPDQRVVMLPLNGARLRRFDAVLLVGAGAAHLPSQPAEVLFFANAVRRECGLATRETRQRQQLRDLAELILSNPEVVLSWQGERNGEPQAPSPWLEQLQLAQERDGAPPLAQTRCALTQRRLPLQPGAPARVAAPQLVPRTLSASGYQSLMACPYQFFAGRMLGLAALDELSDELEKRDYGDWLHAILKRFHEQWQAEPAHDPAPLLQAVSDAYFAKVLQQSPAALAYQVRWNKAIPAYLAWLRAHGEQGWRFERGEVACERTLAWDGGQIVLRGRIDRIDRNLDRNQESYLVLDYKTRKLADLAKRLVDGEDQQLPFYGLLAEAAVGSVDGAAYVALDPASGNSGAAPDEDFHARTAALQGALARQIAAIGHGALLVAQGSDSACQYCEMRGLCRKGGAW